MTRPLPMFVLVALGVRSVVAATADAPAKGVPGTVTLALAEYDRLLERGRATARKPEPPPVPAVLGRAELSVRVADGIARGAFSLEGDVFRAGPTRVPLVAAPTVLEARVSGKPLPLVREAGLTSGILTGPAAFSVTLEWADAVVTEPGRASFSLPVPAAGSVRASLDLPGDQLDVRVEPGLVTRRSSAGGRTLVEATLEPGRAARVSWSARETPVASAERELRLLSDVKTLVSLGESETRITALVEITVLQGDPRRFALRLPPRYEVSGLSGHNLDTWEEKEGVLTVSLVEGAPRRSVFLLSLERPQVSRSFDMDLATVEVEGAHREAGEVAIEGASTLELLATESGTMRRLDVRETHTSLRALAHRPLLAAFRYHRRTGEGPKLVLGVRRFDDASVLAALAEDAQATTLVTGDGRMLTEIALTVRNQAQPFLRVSLPPGATLVSADVAGEGVKPVQGDGGSRVPLLRPGFRPNGTYRVSFTYLHSVAALGRKGTAEITLPRLDLPINLLRWELFLPDRYKVKGFAGDALRADLLPVYDAEVAGGVFGGVLGGVAGGVAGGMVGGISNAPPVPPARPGQIVGRVTDHTGSPLPGATVVVRSGALRRMASTDAEGRYVVEGVGPGSVEVEADLPGFAHAERALRFDPALGSRVDIGLDPGNVAESVTVQAEDVSVSANAKMARARVNAEAQPAAPSLNVLNLQRRVAGVLPVHIEVPRQGTSHRFLRPLVVDEETSVRFRYAARR